MAAVRLYLKCCHKGFLISLHTFQPSNFLIRYLIISGVKGCISNKAFLNLAYNSRLSAYLLL